MTETTLALSAAARKLSPAERAELVDQILDSLDASGTSTESEWTKEAEDRLSAYRRGEIRSLSLSEVLAKYRAA